MSKFTTILKQTRTSHQRLVWAGKCWLQYSIFLVTSMTTKKKHPVHMAFWLNFKAYWLDQILVLHQLIYAKHKSGSSPLLPILRCWQPKYLKRPNRGKEKGGGRLSPFITPTSGLILYSIASPCSTILSLQLYFEKRNRSLHKYCTVLSKFEWTLCFQILRVAMGLPTMVSAQIFLYPNILKFFPNKHETSKYP